jgi:hypothetical protein
LGPPARFLPVTEPNLQLLNVHSRDSLRIQANAVSFGIPRAAPDFFHGASRGK